MNGPEDESLEPYQEDECGPLLSLRQLAQYDHDGDHHADDRHEELEVLSQNGPSNTGHRGGSIHRNLDPFTDWDTSFVPIVRGRCL